MLCCCCWPPYLRALALAVIDTAVVAIFTFRSANLLHRSGNWINYGIFLILLAFSVCELLSLSALALSHHRNNSRYVLPRLTLLTGQFTITLIICVILILYFMGFSGKFNEIIINSYEYWTGQRLSDVDRANAAHELFMHAIGILILLILYMVYELFELYITRKYRNTLSTPPEFIPVRHREPPRPAGPNINIDQTPHFIPPPPPYNPQYCK